MKRITFAVCLLALAGGVASQGHDQDFGFWDERPGNHRPHPERSFQRIATLGNYLNNGDDAADETVSEIIAATANGRTLIYDPKAATWSFVSWELAPLQPLAAWTGLSEITRLQDGGLVLVERDNLTGDFAALKTLVRVPSGAGSDGLISASEKATYDLLPHLLATNGWITDKVEGVAVTSTGRVHVSTDNDGVDDWNGETWFFSPGRIWNLFD